jgi:hypothetical protein
MLAKVQDQRTRQKEVTKRKLSYKTRRKPNSLIHRQKKEKTLLEQRQSLTIDLQDQTTPQETTRI